VVLQEREYVSVSSSMCLSLDWCHTGSKNQIALSHSDRLISVVDVGQAKTVVLYLRRCMSLRLGPHLMILGIQSCYTQELMTPIFVLGIFAKALIPLFFGTVRGTTWEFVAFRETQKLRTC
jgi:hypothetical protein